MASPTEPSSEDFKEAPRRPSKNFIEDVLYTAKKSESVNFHRHDDIPPSGAAILLANPHRLSKAELQTPQQDFNLMEQALQGLNFITVAKLLDDTTEKRQVKEIITQTSRLDLARYASFLFYYSGHADESGLVLPDSHMIEYSFVIESVCKCESLQGKPKIFIFDCSRSPVRGGRVHAEPLTEENIPGDCVVVFATRHKGLAFGNPDKGSFFTSILAESLRHTLTRYVCSYTYTRSMCRWSSGEPEAPRYPIDSLPTVLGSPPMNYMHQRLFL